MFDPTSRSKWAIWHHLLLVCFPILIAAQEDPELAKFGDVIPVFGQMTRTDQDFVDGLALDLFSPKNRTLVVTNNTSPLSGRFVQGSTGEGFVNLSKYSWIIKFNESAHDLIAKIELPYDPEALEQQGIALANTYVGTLAADKKSWVVSETQRNVHITENKTRIIKMTSLDGEYMLLGRKSADTSNIFVQYGQGATRTVNVTGGAENIQEAEFVDGLRLKIQSEKPFALNVDIPFGVGGESIPESHKPLNSFVWKINSTAPTNNIAVNMRFPVNEQILRERVEHGQAKHSNLLVARRALNANSTARFEPLKDQHFDKSNQMIHVKGMKNVDGQYVILVSAKKAKCSVAHGDSEDQQAKGASPDNQGQEACTKQALASGAAKEGSTESSPSPLVTANAAAIPGCLAVSHMLVWGLLLL